ncbi:hypothetical protein VNO77_07620 [Canavalia gladiata]|uniref:Uncharacterized protein n=1 Tax=Canavalia gladiata TaxID=3824 RepID=A0AAN9M7S3_CANGL
MARDLDLNLGSRTITLSYSNPYLMRMLRKISLRSFEPSWPEQCSRLAPEFSELFHQNLESIFPSSAMAPFFFESPPL